MPEDNEPEQLVLMRRLLDMSVERTQMSAERSQMSAERTYMNAERTLSVWVRTALALMVFGIVIDRFGLLLHRLPTPARHGYLNPGALSHWGGVALVALGMLMALTTGLRFLTYVKAYRSNHETPARHGPFLAPFFALMVVIFGLFLLILLLVVTA